MRGTAICTTRRTNRGNKIHVLRMYYLIFSTTSQIVKCQAPVSLVSEFSYLKGGIGRHKPITQKRTMAGNKKGKAEEEVVLSK
jgi:hypothetical protein